MSEPLPLFPLNTVLFPGVVMPLYIFEERYRSLVRDLIALPPTLVSAFPEFAHGLTRLRRRPWAYPLA